MDAYIRNLHRDGVPLEIKEEEPILALRCSQTCRKLLPRITRSATTRERQENLARRSSVHCPRTDKHPKDSSCDH